MKGSRAHEAMSTKTELALKYLGAHLRIARKRRRLSMANLAERIQVSYQTITRMEKGDPTVAIGIYAATMDIFGFTDNLKLLAVPERDSVGITLEHKRRLPKSKKATDDFDF